MLHTLVKIVTLQAALGDHYYYGLTHRSQLSDNLYKYVVSRSLIAKHPIQNSVPLGDVLFYTDCTQNLI